MAKSIHDIRNNKLNIYLIKEKYINEADITKFDDDSSILRIDLKDVGTFYYSKSFKNTPDWISSFFKNDETLVESQIFSAGTKAVLLVDIIHNNKKRLFAIPFGTGRFLLNEFCFEERFGLITTLNIIESNNIRGLDKKTLSSNPKISREQIAKVGNADDFQIDFEKDLLQSITGRSNDLDFGNIITGKEALSISTKVDVSNIKEFLKKAITTFEKVDYKKNFKWVDQIKEVKIPEIVNQLNEELIVKLSLLDDNIWLAVPEIIDWTNFSGFKYSKRKNDPLFPELEIEKITQNESINLTTIEDLEKNQITCWSNDNEIIHAWNLFKCINAEIDLNQKKYLLSNSKWFEIESEYVELVNASFNDIKLFERIDFPDYLHGNEGEYNDFVARKIDAICLDANNIQYGGGHSKIEFCDILTKSKELIHVKRYGGSSVLSHLFNQGLVSGQLLIMDKKFRQLVYEKLITESFDPIITEERPDPSDFKVVYAIISKKNNLQLPFFSKVTLKNAKMILESYGYELNLALIKNMS